MNSRFNYIQKYLINHDSLHIICIDYAHIVDVVPDNSSISLAEGATTLDIAEERKQDVHIRWNESSGKELETAYRGGQEDGRVSYDARDHGMGSWN